MTPEPPGLLLRSVTVTGCPAPVDVRVRAGRIDSIRGHLERVPGEPVLEARGGQLLPGLHDHHLHLRALAAAHASVSLDPADAPDPAAVRRVLGEADRSLPPGGWIRATGYHESVSVDLDRRALDQVVPHRPVRVQHRSGSQWSLNSAGLAAVRAGEGAPPGVETDPDGEPTGRIRREDTWLRSRLPPVTLDLAALSREAAGRGVTGFTDATPHESERDLAELRTLAADGTIVQRLRLMAAPGTPWAGAGVPVIATKVLLADDRLPALGELTRLVAAEHAGGRRVAVHCVTRVQGVLAVAAFEQAGALAGDRIEHGAVLAAETVRRVAELGLTVVTQPALVRTRGDRYLEDLGAGDLPDLWRLGSLRRAGAGVAAGTDAPYGPADPWVSIEAACARRTARGRRLGQAERVRVDEAVALFFGGPTSPAVARRVRPGSAADLCLLEGPLTGGGGLPGIAATLVGGSVVFAAGVPAAGWGGTFPCVPGGGAGNGRVPRHDDAEGV